MTPEKFNKLSLDDKFTWITKRLNGQPVGFCNQLLFRDKVIIFYFGRNWRPAAASAENLSKRAKKVTTKILDQAKANCLNNDCSEEPAYRQKVFDAIFSESPQKN